MARKTDLIEEKAVQAAKELKSRLANRGRGAAKAFLSSQLHDVPRLNVHIRKTPTPEQTSEWRCKLLVKIDKSFSDYPPLLADTLEMLTKASDYETADWLVRRKLQDAGVDTRHRGQPAQPDMMLRAAADYGAVDTEVLLAMNDLYMQQAQQIGNGTAAAWRFDLPTYLIGRLSVGQSLGKKLEPETTLALINNILRLPHRRFPAAANETMLRLAVSRSAQLLSETPRETGKGEISRAAVWQAYLRAGIHLSSHLCANDNVKAGRELFSAFDGHCYAASREYPNHMPLIAAHLRLLHKWYKYEEVPDPYTDVRGKPMVRNIYNAKTERFLYKFKKNDPVDQSILMRMARFERDAGGKKFAYELLRAAVKMGGTNPWPQTILQSWRAADDAPKPKKKKRPQPAPKRPKDAMRHHKQGKQPAAKRT